MAGQVDTIAINAVAAFHPINQPFDEPGIILCAISTTPVARVPGRNKAKSNRINHDKLVLVSFLFPS
jgi:hypothetical protein